MIEARRRGWALRRFPRDLRELLRPHRKLLRVYIIPLSDIATWAVNFSSVAWSTGRVSWPVPPPERSWRETASPQAGCDGDQFPLPDKDFDQPGLGGSGRFTGQPVRISAAISSLAVTPETAAESSGVNKEFVC